MKAPGDGDRREAPRGVLSGAYASARRLRPELIFRYKVRALMVAEAAERFLDGMGPFKVLDLGAAEGLTLLEIRRLLPGGDYLGVELSDDLVRGAVPLPADTRIIKGDATRLPPCIDNGRFDIVCALALLEHLADPMAAVREAVRALRPGGIFVATCPSPAWDAIAIALGLFDGRPHVTRVGRDGLVSAARAAALELLAYERFMWMPVASLPYLRIHVAPDLSRRLDRLAGDVRLFDWLFVNQCVVARKGAAPAATPAGGRGMPRAPALAARARRAWRIASSVARVRFGGARMPLFASLEITRRCDGRCRYCGSRGYRGRELTRAEWLSIIDDLAASGALGVNFTGGEPLLRPELPELIARCHRHGIPAELNTGGRLLPAMLGSLPPVSFITLSLDGDEEVNDAVRWRGSFDAAMAAYRAARAASIPCGFLSVLSPESIEGIDAFLALVGRERLPVMFQPVFELYLRGRRPNPHQPDPARLGRAIDLITAAKRRGLPIRNSFAGLAYLRTWPGPTPITCGGGRYFLRISSAGAMEICGLKSDATPPGIDARDGILAGMARMKNVSCGTCWCGGRTELNLALGLSPAAVGFVLRRVLSKGRAF